MGTSSGDKLRDFLSYAPFALRDTFVLRRFSRALGDNLMLSMLAREVRRHYPGKKIVVETNWPELFLHNPHVDLALRHKVAWAHCKPTYRIEEGHPEHVLDQLAGSLSLPIPSWERRLDFYPSGEELRTVSARLPSDYLVVCPEGKREFASNRKEWGLACFQELVDSMPGRRFVQIGVAAHGLLRGAVDFRGRTIRECAAAIRLAKAAVLLEGGLMHICHAVRTPAVILFGGYVRPEVVGYPELLSVASAPSCSPCCRSHAKQGDCADHVCMEAIAPSAVRAFLEEEAFRRGGTVIVAATAGRPW